MRDSLVDYYARQADKETYGYQSYGGDAAVASLRIFRAYHPDARFAMIDADGVRRWFTPTMLRIHAVLSRESMRPNGDLVKLRDMAKEAQTSPGYLSKQLLRMTAWGMFASISVRGRNGGIYLWARQKGDSFARYAKDAQIHLGVQKVMRAARNLRKYGEMFPSIHTRVVGDTVETFKGKRLISVRPKSASGTSMGSDTRSSGGSGGRITAD